MKKNAILLYRIRETSIDKKYFITTECKKQNYFTSLLFRLTIPVKKICVPSQTREKHIEARVVLKFSGLPKTLFTTYFFPREARASFYAV